MGALVDRRLGERVLRALGIWRVGGGGEGDDESDGVLRAEPLSRAVRGGRDGDRVPARAGILGTRFRNGGGAGGARLRLRHAAYSTSDRADRPGKRPVAS